MLINTAAAWQDQRQVEGHCPRTEHPDALSNTLLKQGHLELVAQVHIWMNFEYFKARKHHNLPKPFVPLRGHCHGERVFFDVQTELSVFQFVSTVFLDMVQSGGLPLLWIISEVSFMQIVLYSLAQSKISEKCQEGESWRKKIKGTFNTSSLTLPYLFPTWPWVFVEGCTTCVVSHMKNYFPVGCLIPKQSKKCGKELIWITWIFVFRMYWMHCSLVL